MNEVFIKINVTVLSLDAADIADLKLLRQRLTRPLYNPSKYATPSTYAPPLTDSERDQERQLKIVERVLKAAEAA